MEENPVTGVKEPYFPERARLSRMFTGSMVIIIMVSLGPDGKQFHPRLVKALSVYLAVLIIASFIPQLCVVMIFLVTVIIYRSIVSVMMYETGSSMLRTQASTQ